MEKLIQMAHGGGGRLSAEFIEEEILPRFGNEALNSLPDAASLRFHGQKLIFSTDSFVISPIEFPGGNIGSLAVHGTVNDISAAGGKPLWFSLGLILEEGLEISVLRKMLDSLKNAAENCGVRIVTGDTKVVPRGHCDKIYINTSGIGEAIDGFDLDKTRLSDGDFIIASGTLGDHGMAVMSARHGLNSVGSLRSDSAPVHRLVQSLPEKLRPSVKFMRDPTRGGTAAVLNEIVSNAVVGINICEADIPFSPVTRAVSEILGLELLNSPCEGRLIMICSEEASAEIIRIWKSLPEGANSAVIGRVNTEAGRVTIKTFGGGKRLLDVPRGELLPRIC